MNKQYVVVDSDWNLLKKLDGYSDMTYDTEKAAKLALAARTKRFAKRGKMCDARVCTSEEYDKHDVMVERTNIMTGKKFMEKRSTPYYLSPSSETYWSR